jgi:hypothetical protein
VQASTDSHAVGVLPVTEPCGKLGLIEALDACSFGE